MKKATTAAALLAAALTLPAFAQDESEASYGEEVPAEENAPAPAPETAADANGEGEAATPVAADDAAAGEGFQTETAAPDTATAESPDAASAEAASLDAGSTEGTSDASGMDAAAADPGAEGEMAAAYSDAGAAGESDAAAEPREPFHLYAGLDIARTKINLSDRARELSLGGDEPRSDMYRLRVGTRLFDAIGLEAHYGIADDKDDEPGRFEVDEAIGLYLVPTGVAFDFLEISVPVGYNMFTAKRGRNEVELDGVSYGVNLEVPLSIGSDFLPDLRLGGGGMVYQAHERARVWGYHFGVRMDFQL